MIKKRSLGARSLALVAVALFGAMSLLPPAPIVSGDAALNPWNTNRLAHSGDEERNIEKYATSQVQPAYPALAQKYKIEGVVIVQVMVSKEGRVAKAEFVRGHTIFRSVSLDAAKMWEFKPPEGDSLVGTIRFTFKLRDK